MATTTDTLLAKLNTLRGLAYPAKGYTYFADIRGDGSNRKSVYAICNDAGGVVYSALNAASAKERCANIRAAIARETEKQRVA